MLPDSHVSIEAGPRAGSLRALGAWFLGLGVVAALVVVYAVHANLPKNGFKLPFERSLAISRFAPEGWKFFTRDPREERASIYVRDDGGWRDASRGTNSSPRNWFGLDRGGRAQGLELGLILEQANKLHWEACDRATASCLDDAPIALRLTNVSPRPSLCGAVGLMLQKPVPWAWASEHLDVHMPRKTIRLEIQC